LIEAPCDADRFMPFFTHFLFPFSFYEIYPTKKPPAWGGFLLSAYCFSCSSRLGQCPPRLANGRAKEKEAKAANLSMHFYLHKKIISQAARPVNILQALVVYHLFRLFFGEKTRLTQLEFLSRFLEAGERTLQGFVINTVRDTEIARRAEASTGYNQHIPLPQLVDKSDLILQR
jgi:hypothetical protein